MPLKDYIAMHYDGNRAAFARAQKTSPQSVNLWLRQEWIVIRHQLYSPRRQLVSPTGVKL